jgi:FkbM family methyltransferase
VAEPNSYWDFGLIWEYCPRAEICVIGDSDDFMMLELRDKSVAQDQIVTGPLDKKEIAERMVTWVTPYQRYFLKFPLALHERDLPVTIGNERAQLLSFVDEVMSNAPQFPSHIGHSQWEYHWARFHDARRLSSRLRSSTQKMLKRAVRPFTQFAALCANVILRAKQKTIELCMPLAHYAADRYIRPALRRLGLEIVKSTTLWAVQEKANEATHEANLWAREATLKAKEATRLKQQQQADLVSITRLKEKITDLNNIATEYQLKLERHDLGYTQRPRFTEWVMRRGLLETAFTLVDVGVQGGIHPRWNALGRALRVYGFDPLEEAIAPLVHFNLPNHEYHAIALGDQDGERDFFVPEALPASSFLPRQTKQDQARMAIDPSNWRGIQTRRVPIRRLDTLMSEGVVPRVDFLKIDCEGFEPAVLKGAGRFLGESGVLGIESEIGFSSIDWPQTHFLAVYEQLLPHGFRLSDLAFNRVHFGSFLERARSLRRETTTASFPGTFEILFSRSLTIAKVVPSRDEVLKAAIIFELYGMLDVAYDLLQVFRSIFPPSAQIEDGADELIPKGGFV